MKLDIPDYISAISPYVPGKPIEELEREYGIRDSVKIASNENPLGPSPKALRAIETALKQLHRYPDGSGHYLIRKLAETLGAAPENIIIGNGSDDIIAMVTRVFLTRGDEAILPRPSFLMYQISVQASGATAVHIPVKDLSIDLDAISGAITPKTRMIFLCNPNNPTGTLITREAFERFVVQAPPRVLIVVDEAYIEFVRNPRCLNSIAFALSDRPVITLRTFSKAYGLAGLRIGYGITSPEIVSLLNRVRQPFNVSLPAQAGALAALDDTDFLEKTRRTVHEEIEFLQTSLGEMGVRYFPTESNFFLVDVRQDADRIFTALLREGVIVRSMTGYGFPRFIRINAGTRKDNQKFLAALSKVLG